MRGASLGLERRRRWGDGDKIALVLSGGVDGATVTHVAQRHEVTRQQIYAWRHELMSKGLLSAVADAILLPLEGASALGWSRVRRLSIRCHRLRCRSNCCWPMAAACGSTEGWIRRR